MPMRMRSLRPSCAAGLVIWVPLLGGPALAHSWSGTNMFQVTVGAKHPVKSGAKRPAPSNSPLAIATNGQADQI